MPTRVAPRSVSAQQSSDILSGIPTYQRERYARGVAERVRTGFSAGESEALILDAIVTEREALARALAAPAMREAFATTYQQAFTALTPKAPLSLMAAQSVVGEVLDNRIRDARQLAALVRDPQFLTQMRANIITPPTDQLPDLPPEKAEDMVKGFLKNEARIHLQQDMHGERIGHMALVEVFTSNAMAVALQQALANELPQYTDAARAQLTAEWLAAREKPARATAQSLDETGVVYKAVMERAAKAKMPVAPLGTVAANDNPTHVKQGPVIHAGKVKPETRHLVMDGL